MVFLYQIILGFIWVNAVFGSVLTDNSGFVKIDVFENSMTEMNMKFGELQKYMLEIKGLMDVQTEVNGIFRKQIVKLKAENTKLKRKLGFVNNKSTRKSGVKKVKMDYEKIDADKNIPKTMEVATVKEVKGILNTAVAEISVNRPYNELYNASNIPLRTSQLNEEGSKISNGGIHRNSKEMQLESNVSKSGITMKFQHEKSTQLAKQEMFKHRIKHTANGQNVHIRTTVRKSDKNGVHLADQLKQKSGKRTNSIVQCNPVVDGKMQLLSRAFQGRQLTEPNESIAFSAFLQQDIPNLQKDQIIKFDGVLINDGNGYDVTTGIFTAPRSGLYLFSYAIEDYSDHLLWVYLRHDNKIRSSAVAKPYAEHQNVMGSNTLLLKVDAGSRVWISVYTGNRVQNDWTTFSGVLLH